MVALICSTATFDEQLNSHNAIELFGLFDAAEEQLEQLFDLERKWVYDLLVAAKIDALDCGGYLYMLEDVLDMELNDIDRLLKYLNLGEVEVFEEMNEWTWRYERANSSYLARYQLVEVC